MTTFLSSNIYVILAVSVPLDGGKYNTNQLGLSMGSNRNVGERKMSILSDRLRLLRGTSSQSDMATAANMKYQQWARYEKGEVVPGADVLATICKVHAVSADWLLGLSDGHNTSDSKPPPQTINLDELRETASQLAAESTALASTIKKLKKML